MVRKGTLVGTVVVGGLFPFRLDPDRVRKKRYPENVSSIPSQRCSKLPDEPIIGRHNMTTALVNRINYGHRNRNNNMLPAFRAVLSAVGVAQSLRL